MITSIIVENCMGYIKSHSPQENNKQELQQGLVVYP